MKTLVSYQSDSTQINNGLELINEQDEISQDTLKMQGDTFYGVQDEQNIPHRIAPKTQQKELKVNTILYTPEIHTNTITTWQTILLLLCLFLVGFIKAFNHSRFTQSVKALLSYSVAQEITREEKVFFHRANLLLTFIHITTSSLFIYHFSHQLNSIFRLEGPLFYVIIFGSIASIYLIKYLFSKILFFVFNNLSVTSEYIFSITLFNNLLGGLLILLLAILYYTPIQPHIFLNYLTLPTISIVLIMRVFRLIIIGKSYGISYFYIFLYICTLEILPLVVLFRIFIFE